MHLAEPPRWQPGSPGLLYGPSAVFRLAHRWLAHLAPHGVHVIDCGMRFNVFRFADEVRERGWPIDPLLESVTLQRAFTPYQLLDAIAELPDVPVTLLAPTKQFFDGDVAHDEAAFLLRRLTESISRIRQPTLVVEKDNYRHAAFPAALHGLKAVSGTHWLLIEGESAGSCLPGSNPGRRLRVSHPHSRKALAG